MADRATRVTLTVNAQNYVSGMQQAARATRETGAAAETLGQRSEALEKVGKVGFAAGGLLAAGVGLAIAKYAEFDTAVSGIQAATHATGDEMTLLRQASIQAGAATVFSATEAANAVTELSKAGVSTADILKGGLNGSLSLAAAGQLDVADAASIAATAMTQFNLKGSEVPHVADLLAAGAGKAQGSVEDLSQALNQGGLVASQAGFSIDETTGTLAAFASAGLLGSDAGTSLKTAILALEAPSSTAAKAMAQYGINVYDANGKLDSFSQIAGVLQDKLGGLTDQQRNSALATIFGTDAVRAASVLYKDGAKGIQDWTDKVNDNGYAAETARLQMNNLKGDLEQLSGSFDTALIQTGSAANGSLRTLAQSATFLVNAVGSAPQPLLNAGLAVAAVGGGIALTGGAALIAVPKVSAFKAQLDTLGISAGKATLSAVGMGVALGGATLAIGLLVQREASIKAGTSTLTDTLDKTTGAITKYTKASIAKSLADDGTYKTAKEAGVSQKELTDSVLKGGKAYDDVLEKIGKLNSVSHAFDGGALSSIKAQDSIHKLSQELAGAKDGFKDVKATGASLADANGQVADTADDASTSLQAVGTAAVSSADDLDTLQKRIEGFGNTQLDLNSATRDYEAAIDGLTASVKDNGKTLDVTTDAGRKNQAALDDIAKSTLGLAAATLAQTGNQDDAAKAVANGRDELIKAAGQLGITGQAAQDLANNYGLIPQNVYTKAYLDNQTAIAQAAALDAQVTALTRARRIPVSIDITGTGPGGLTALTAHGNIAFARGGIADYYADGGVTESHVAQIAPVGTTRIWNEPETGGEAYIPLAAAKRTRSLAIWQETGKRINAYADGGMYQPHYTHASAAPAATALNVNPSFTVTLAPKGGVDILKYVDVKIQQADSVSALTARAGKQKR